MAMNFSSAIINATQTALIALPQLAARYGWKNATKALGMATVDYFRSADKRFKWFGKDSSWLDKDAWRSMGRSKHLSQDEIDLIRRLNEDGVISITQASSLAQRSEAAKDRMHNRLLENATVIGGPRWQPIAWRKKRGVGILIPRQLTESQVKRSMTVTLTTTALTVRAGCARAGRRCCSSSRCTPSTCSIPLAAASSRVSAGKRRKYAARRAKNL